MQPHLYQTSIWRLQFVWRIPKYYFYNPELSRWGHFFAGLSAPGYPSTINAIENNTIVSVSALWGIRLNLFAARKYPEFIFHSIYNGRKILCKSFSPPEALTPGALCSHWPVDRGWRVISEQGRRERWSCNISVTDGCFPNHIKLQFLSYGSKECREKQCRQLILPSSAASLALQQQLC